MHGPPLGPSLGHKDSLLFPPSPQEKFYKGMYFYKCDGGSSILTETSSKPNWNPTTIPN